MQKSILVVGNGSIGQDKNCSKSYINNRTGQFLRNLKKEKFEVTYLEPLTEFDFHSNLQNFCLEDNGISFVSLHQQKGIKKLGLLFKISSLIRNNDFIYIFIPGTLGRIVGLLSILLLKPYGIYLRGEVKLTFFNKIVLHKASFILTVSPHLKELVTPHQENIDCIRPMIDINPNDLYKKEYQFRENITVLYVGNLSIGKGIMELLEVALRFEKVNPQITFRIVGGGALYSDLQQTKLPSNIILTGQIEDKEALLKEFRQADVFYFPSHTEGFPRVLFEAMSQSLPIFTTMVGGISGYMRANENCIAIPEKDSIRQFEIISSNLENETILNQIASNSFNTINEILKKMKTHEHLLISQIKEIF